MPYATCPECNKVYFLEPLEHVTMESMGGFNDTWSIKKTEETLNKINKIKDDCNANMQRYAKEGHLLRIPCPKCISTASLMRAAERIIKENDKV